ncbi:MAG TPA: BREX-2 system phosphatase PglZ [Micromonosporaceae bacterium]
MSSAPTRPRLLRISPVALTQKVQQQLDQHRNGTPYPVMVIRAEPVWTHDPTLTLADGRHARVVACPSPLAIWEQLVAERGEEVLVLLTDRTQTELGTGILSQVFRQQVITVEPWDLVVNAFGAQYPDAALEAESWAGEALLDAMPPGGWPRLAGTVLPRDVALRHLAAVRLNLPRLDAEPDDLDATLLLRWSTLPGAVEAFGLLRATEREGLARWLATTYGRPAAALIALINAGNGTDALPLALVCDALWTTDTPDALRARGRVDGYFGDASPGDEVVRSFAEAGVHVVTGMLTARDDVTARRQAHAVLDRAEELLVQFGAAGCAGHSRILRSGFTQRISAVADALLTAVRQPSADPGLDAHIEALAAHQLAETETRRIRRARMAHRLVRWLATQTTPPASVADGIDRQIAEWGWVDRALGEIWAGEDVHPGLQAAFRDVYRRAYERRRELDRAFAQRLAAWTAAGSPPDDLLTVETLLPRVVVPLLKSGRPTLLVVLDGMSAAVAIELAEQLSEHLVEYDPLAGSGPGRRRGAVAGLPTLTAVSRTSLFAGTLLNGNQATEKQIFDQKRWGEARIFHKKPAQGGAGETFATELAEAIAGTDRLVAVVINTVDESLSYGREGDEPGWTVEDVGFLRSLLDLARSNGRAVIITSDHGHVLDRGSELVRAPDAASARHRLGPDPARDGEVELTGPRVIAPDNRVVALWDPGLRYRPGRAGYHGGASLAEVTVPLLAFLMPNATEIPTGWAAVDSREPEWWRTTAPVSRPQQPLPPPRTLPKPRRRTVEPAGSVLFDIPAPAQPDLTPTATATGAGAAGDGLVAALLQTELFAAQRALTPRPLPVSKIEAALTALLDSNVLPTVVVAARAGEPAIRATGFVVTLQRILNVDNYPVLSLIDNNRTVRLDVALLREQFNLPAPDRPRSGAGE